ncbi:MAG: Sporulation initiation phosphotransferase F [Calditrichaeota bacterium]|nr:Sporulation initiation phosphotransferase F [Calditrichota bacterium]
MAIISFFSGPFCRGDEVADLTAERMGYRRIDADVLARAGERLAITSDRIRAAMSTAPGFLGKPPRDRERVVAHVRLALAELIQEDNAVHHGYAGHMLPRSIGHVFRVCLIANFDHRVQRAMAEARVGEKQAVELVHKLDRKRVAWTQYVANRPPYEAEDYDLLLPMHADSVEDAAGRILLSAGSDSLRTTEASRQAARDFLLAAKVQLAVAEKAPAIEVSARNGNVTIKLNRYVSRLDAMQKQLSKLAAEVEGVESVNVIPGTGFVPPSLIPAPDLPAKILLVDDEKEFVHSLSERLQTRNLESSVVYDGEQALEFVRESEPEVMVLDLKMPGIDGIEVLRRMKRDHPHVEVIILTGHGSDREQKLARELGAFAYLTKPVNIEVLAETLQAAYRKIGSARAEGGGDG